jgi:hypothetical protein
VEPTGEPQVSNYESCITLMTIQISAFGYKQTSSRPKSTSA